jgi:hypothetical protein
MYRPRKLGTEQSQFRILDQGIEHRNAEESQYWNQLEMYHSRIWFIECLLYSPILQSDFAIEDNYFPAFEQS